MIASILSVSTTRFSALLRPAPWGAIALVAWGGVALAAQEPEPEPAPLPPVLRLHFPAAGQNAKSTAIDFTIHTNPGHQCYSYLFRVFGQRTWQVPWRNLAPYGEVDFSSSPAAGRGHYLIAKDYPPTAPPWPQQAATGLYLARHSGSAFGDRLIITDGHIPKLSATHLFCGTATQAISTLWRQDVTSASPVTLRLIGSRHKVVRYPFLPALSRGKAQHLTIKAAQKAARSLATTFDLSHPNKVKLANYRSQGELIQVNYTISFADRDRDLVLIGAYTNGIFATKHLHFSP